ncbi:MAG: right-handed parallel beta-helix repeat-containing protein [Thermoplasmata archaeon]
MGGRWERGIRSGAVAAFVVLAFLVISGLSGVATIRYGQTQLQPEFSSTFQININGSVSAPGIFGQSGPGENTYTLLADYAGTVADYRNGSVLVGAGFKITYTTGSADILVFGASNVSVAGFQLTGAGTAITIADSTNVTVGNNTESTTGEAVYVDESTSVTVFDNYGLATGGVEIDSSALVAFTGNNFTQFGGAEATTDSSLALVGNDFSHAVGDALVLEYVSSFQIHGNRFNSPGGDDALNFDMVAFGNISENNLTANLEPVYVANSGNLTFWNNTVSAGTDEAYSLEGSDGIAIVDSTALGAGDEGAYVSNDVGITFAEDNFSGSAVGVDDLDSAGVLIENSDLVSGATGVNADETSDLTIIGSDLGGGNNGLVAQQTSTILWQNSTAPRANYALNLTDGTRDVMVEDSNLSGTQIAGVYLDGDSDITITDSRIQPTPGFPIDYAVQAGSTQGLTISSSNLSGTPGQPALVGVETFDSNDSSLVNDSLEWTDSPFTDTGSAGIQIVDSNLTYSGAGDGISLDLDQQVSIANTDVSDAAGDGISTFDVTNLTVHDSIFTGDQENGIVLNAPDGVSITGSTFDNIGENGIFAGSPEGLVVTGNTLINDSYPFFISGGTNVVLADNQAGNDQDGGPDISEVEGLVLDGNNFSGDSSADLTDVVLGEVYGYTITDNTFLDDDVAVEVEGMSTGTVVGNSFHQDNVSLYFDGPVASLNYHNDFLSDASWQIEDSPVLAWDDGYPTGGNFWSNYTGVDEFSGPDQNIPGPDGIGDTPFVLDESDIDHYPLMTAWADHAALFVESGLPSGTPWSVVFNSTTYSTTGLAMTVSSTLGVQTPYVYSIATVGNYSATPAHGSGILGAGLIVVDVTFAIPTFPLTFTESGLPAGTSWEVSVSGSAHVSSAGSLVVNLANSTYSYSVTPVPGYSVTPANGHVTLKGGSETVALTFVVYTFAVTVVQSGLASGTSWGVTVGLNRSTATGSSLVLALANGSYTYTVNPVSGFTPTAVGGSWSVSGGPVTSYIEFVANSSIRLPTPGSKAPSTADLLPYLAVIGVLAVLAAVGWVLAIRNRRGDRPPEGPSTPLPPPPPPPGPS